MDRYNHDLTGGAAGDETDDTTDDSPLFGSFSSYSPQYRKQNSYKFLSTITSDDGGGGTLANNPSAAVVVVAATAKVSPSEQTYAQPELRSLDVSAQNRVFFYSYLCCFLGQNSKKVRNI